MSYPAIATLPGGKMSAALCRMVPKAMLESRIPPNYLLTTGNPARFNTRGVECIYASEDLPTAATEYERYNLTNKAQAVAYWVYVEGLVLDLGDVTTLTALGLTVDQLYLPWRGLKVKGPTATQQLGDEVAAQTRIAGIRFPSDAARVKKTTGFNAVFFRKAVQSPDSLVVKDDKGRIVQSWP